MNADLLQTALIIIRATDESKRLAATRSMLALFDPYEPDDETNMAPVVCVCLDAYAANRTIINTRALTVALEMYYLMH